MFQTIWTSKKNIDKDNQKLINMIAAEEATCCDFPISCHERYGVWGIWFHDEKDYLLVEPLDLVNSIYEDDNYYMLENYSEDEGHKTEGSYIVVAHKWEHCFSWRILNTNSQYLLQCQFSYEEYIGKIRNCMDKLYEVWGAGETIAYHHFYHSMESVELCKKQLSVSGVTPSHYQLMVDDISLETFIFHPLKDNWTEHYEIGIADRTYKTFMTHWDNDMELIRHQLESYIYGEKSIIELNFDALPTVLKLRYQRILDKHEDTGDGYKCSYKDYILVEIISNGFANMPILKGYCDEKATIKSLYEGLLFMASRHPIEGKDSAHDNYPSNLVAYNRYKSPVIESFLRGDERIPNTYRTRQVHVEEILRIDPDVDCYIWDQENVGLDVGCLKDKEGNPIEMEELDKWANEIKPFIIETEVGKRCKKDWTDYHRRGIALAKKLRGLLPSTTDLWYEAPFEDKSGTIPHRMLIY